MPPVGKYDVDLEMKPTVHPTDNVDNNQSDTIPGTELEEFIQLLENDDLQEFKKPDPWPPERRQRYFQGKFDYDNEHAEHVTIQEGVFQIPFNLALGHAAENIVQEFIDFEVDLTRCEDEGNNVLHVLAMSSIIRPNHHETFVNICKLILNHLTTDQFSSLCSQENSQGLRPLELASKLGTFGIFSSILLHPGYICSKRAQTLGMSKVYKYDLTDYQLGGDLKRLFRSPMTYMAYTDKQGLESLMNYDILRIPLIQKWIKQKILSALPFLLLWWMMRLTYVCTIAFVDPSVYLYKHACTDGGFNRTSDASFAKSNNTNQKTYFEQCDKLANLTSTEMATMLGILTAVEVYSWFMIVMDILEVVICLLLLSDRRKAYKRQYFADFPAYTRTYRVSQFALYLFGVLAPILAKYYTGGEAFTVLLFIKALQLPSCLMSFLFIVEFLPVVGEFAITLQKMMKSLIIFLSFLLPVKFIFSQFFSFFAADEGFGTSVGHGVYLLFLMDMGSFDFGTTPEPLIKIVHVFYFLIMVILLFNYLIAVLSLVADETRSDIQALIQLRRLEKIVLLEERFIHWIWKLVSKVKRLQPFIIYAQAPQN